MSTLLNGLRPCMNLFLASFGAHTSTVLPANHPLVSVKPKGRMVWFKHKLQHALVWDLLSVSDQVGCSSADAHSLQVSPQVSFILSKRISHDLRSFVLFHDPWKKEKWCRWFGFGSGVIEEVLGIASLVLFYMPWLWEVSKKAVAACGASPENQILVTIAFFLLDSIKDTVISLPFSLYNTFVIEQRWALFISA